MLSKILVSVGSIATFGFGVWHFFVPKIWSWYSYIKPEAKELIAAVRAINVFFSLCLVLIAVADMIFVFSENRLGLIVMLAISSILWGVRAIMQLVYPQGSINPALQYGMLGSFIVIFICFALCLVLAVSHRA